MQYVFVTYIYNLNAIIVCPMPARSEAAMILAFSEVFSVRCAQDYHPALNVMDNECSKGVKKNIWDNKMGIQLVPLHNHCINANIHAIATFKEHFVAALVTVNILCPLQLWDKFLSQVELTLNLLQFSQRNPGISVNQEIYGALNFNTTPLTSLGTKALMFNNPTTQASWAPHATDSFYIGPSTNHYHCLRFYIPAMHRFHFSDTWQLFLTHCQVPAMSKHDKSLLAAAGIFPSNNWAA